MRKIPLLVPLLAFILAAPLAGHAESLMDAFTDAYRNNPTLRGAEATVRAADANLGSATAERHPQLNGYLHWGWLNENDTDYIAGAPNYSATEHFVQKAAGLELRQILWQSGLIDDHIAVARANIMASRAQLAQSEIDVLRDAAGAYADVLLAQKTLALDQENEAALHRVQAFTEWQVKLQDATVTDLHEAQTRLHQATATRIRDQAQLVTAGAQYRRIVGHAPTGLEPAATLRGLPASLDRAQALADETPAVRAASFTQQAAARSIESARDQAGPTVEVVGRYDSDYQDAYGIKRSADYSLLLVVKIPLYSGGVIGSQLRQARSTDDQRRLELDSAKRTALRQISQAWSVLQVARAALAPDTEAVRATRDALTGLEAQRVQGQTTTQDVLNGRMDYVQASQTLAQAEHDLTVAEAAMLAAVGQLNAAHFALPVTPFDAEADADKNASRWWDIGYLFEK